MRKLYLVLLLGVIGCNNKRDLVELSAEATPKTVMIYVPTVVSQTVLVIKDNDIAIEKTTATITVTGSGVFISPNGHVLTADHLLTAGIRGDVTVCRSNGECSKGEVLYEEGKLDLALLKIYSENTPFAAIADPRKLAVGQSVFSIGNPLGFPWSLSHGVISALNRDMSIYNMTQSDTFNNPGNSGGPMFNYEGEVIGINDQLVSPINAPIFTGLGFSVQCGQIREFLTRFKSKVEGL